MEKMTVSLGNGEDMQIGPSRTLERMAWSKEIAAAGLSVLPAIALSSSILTAAEDQLGDLDYSGMESELMETVLPYQP